LVYDEIRTPARKVKNTCIILDPHGDMADEIAHFSEFSKPHIRDRLVLIDPMLKQGFSPCLNPFELDSRSEKNIAIMTQELKRIIEILLTGAGITNQMEAIIHPCIATLLRRP